MDAQKIMITCAIRMSYHPAKYKPLLVFATAGAAISLGVALAAISSLGDNWTYLFAHTITIAFPSFLIGPPPPRARDLPPPPRPTQAG